MHVVHGRVSSCSERLVARSCKATYFWVNVHELKPK